MFKSQSGVVALALMASVVLAQTPPAAKPKDAFSSPSGGGGGTAEWWMKQLKDKDPRNRVKAADALGGQGEAAADAAGPLCDALLDSSPKVATAAIHAIEKVRPDLYKPLTALMVDNDPRNRLAGAKELGLMGDKAAPAINVVLACLRKELAKGPDPYGRLTAMQTELFNAVRQMRPDDADTVKMYKSIAAVSNRYTAARGEALAFLFTWAGDDEARRKEVLPLVRAGLSDGTLQIQCIRYLGDYGPLAKICVPQLKQLKLSSVAAVREAATSSLDKIENQ